MNISNNPTVPAANPVKTDKPAASKNSVPKESGKSEKVQKVIEEFEGVFMSMMIKQLRETDSGEGFFPGDHSDTYGGMFDMFMGQHLARGSQTGLESLFESTTAKNLQANAICERMHQAVGNSLRVLRQFNPPAGAHTPIAMLDTALANAMYATRVTFQASILTTPGAMAFHRDMVMNVPFMADLNLIQQHRQQISNREEGVLV